MRLSAPGRNLAQGHGQFQTCSRARRPGLGARSGLVRPPPATLPLTLPLPLPPLADSAPELRRRVGLGAESPENAGLPLQTGVAAGVGWRLSPRSQGYHCPTARSGQGSAHLGFQFRCGRRSRVCFAWVVSNSTANLGILN